MFGHRTVSQIGFVPLVIAVAVGVAAGSLVLADEPWPAVVVGALGLAISSLGVQEMPVAEALRRLYAIGVTLILTLCVGGVFRVLNGDPPRRDALPSQQPSQSETRSPLPSPSRSAVDRSVAPSTPSANPMESVIGGEGGDGDGDGSTSTPDRPDATESPRGATRAPTTPPPVTVSSSPLSSPRPSPSVSVSSRPFREGRTNGCNTYGQNCDDNPIYVGVPEEEYDHRAEAKVATVPNNTLLKATCWTTGGTTYNYAARSDPPDPGPDPYESKIYFNVQAPNGGWGYIPDTYFVRDKERKLGLPQC